jgi:SWI/SNF-related matrix-associated actin-dependent regulator of chromatin subfamily A3
VLDAKLVSDNSSPVLGHCQMTITKCEEQFVAAFSDGTIFGEANAQLERAFGGIAEQRYQIDLEVFAPIQPVRETISRATKEKEAVVRVNINVYGPRSSVQGVGQELSSHKIYLQKPDHMKAGFTYDNPHVLKLSNFQLPVTGQILEVREEKESESESQKAEAFKKTISTIYSSLTRGHTLTGLEGDERLKTKLLT